MTSEIINKQDKTVVTFDRAAVNMPQILFIKFHFAKMKAWEVFWIKEWNQLKVLKLFGVRTPLHSQNYRETQNFMYRLYLSVFSILEPKLRTIFKYLLVHLKITGMNSLHFDINNNFMKV